MKKLFLALSVIMFVGLPTIAKADIAPDPTPYIEPSQPIHYEEAGIRTEQGLTNEEFVLLQFPRALYLTILIELIVAAIVIAQQKLAKRVLFSVPLATLITLPLFWWWYMAIYPTMGGVFFAEAVVIAAEALIIFSTQKVTKITWKQATAISIAINVVSTAIGYTDFIHKIMRID